MRGSHLIFALLASLTAMILSLLPCAHLALALSTSFSEAAVAKTGPVTITANTTIGCSDTTYDGMDVIIDGADVTIDCAHQFASLQLINGAVVTHSSQLEEGCQLSIAGDLLVDYQSRFDGNGRGYWVGDPVLGAGPGAGETPESGEHGAGAGHGGGGSNGSGTLGGCSYGSHEFPNMLGSGGTNTTGGRGGGRFQLDVDGEFRLAGLIRVNGNNGANCCGGGGAAGSVWITAGVFSGAGSVQAIGGSGSNSGGGGGGGRIAVHYGTNLYTGEIGTYGGNGNGSVYGGVGTYFQKRFTATRGVLLLDAQRSTSSHANTEMTGPMTITATVLLRRGARLGPAYGTPMDLTVDGDLVIDSSSWVYGAGRGHETASGPAAGQPSDASTSGSGGSHGGRGYNSRSGLTPVLDVNGDWLEPVSMGSGGGRRNGGNGGGAVKLTVLGDLICEGRITANGFGAGESHAGGGAGGSVNIRCNSLIGNGTIDARGGNGSADGGGGGGGRIALRYTDWAFRDDGVQAYGGSIGWTNPYYGGAGTIYREDLATGWSELTFDSFGAANSLTRVDGPLVVPGNLRVRRLARLQPLPQQPLDITVGGDLVIEADGVIGANSLGYPAASGPGAGQPSNTSMDGSGGAHGGWGYSSRDGATALLNVYGSPFDPDTMGSGGGRANGGAGGGIVRLDVAGELVVDGFLRANGGGGASSHGGGGAGGTVNVRCGTISGLGSIQAIGGNGSADGGGGGGGRIALRYNTWGFPDDGSHAGGGAIGWTSPYYGGCGTIYREDLSTGWNELLFDGQGRANSNTYVESPLVTTGHVRIRGLARVRPDGNELLEIMAGGDMVIEADGTLAADNQGYLQGEGPGGGVTGPTSRGSGGSHGGFGHVCSTGLPPSPSYGDPMAPTTLGSGGGYVNGGVGGGAVRIEAGGALIVDGLVSVNGQSSIGTNGGGGAAGSFFATCAQFGGDALALIRANGGNATSGSSGSGAGGGGRIAVHFDETSFTGTFQARGGDDDCTNWAGAGTVYTRNRIAQEAELLIDNGGAYNQGTGLVGPTLVDGDVVIRGSGRLVPPVRQAGAEPSRLILTVLGDLRIEQDGYLDANLAGYGREEGPGAGVRPLGGRGSGAGHGGRGGDSSTGAPGGATYGSDRAPDSFGSGGGDGLLGGLGGGAVRLDVAGDLLVNGYLDAVGGNAANGEAGGGSGGSIWLTARVLSGTGQIRAYGGSSSGSGSGGAGGGGGHIAIHTECQPEFGLGTIQMNGGSGDGAPAGEAGTLFYGYVLPASGDVQISSNDPADAIGFSGNLIQEVFTGNNGPPVYEPALWQPVLRRRDEYVERGFQCTPYGAYETATDLDLVGAPVSTELGIWESSTSVRVFREGAPQALTAPLIVDVSGTGIYDELGDLDNSLLTAGTTVLSHFVHFDPTGSAVTALGGSVTFDADIVGILVLDASLDATDGLFGSANTIYPTGLARRGLDFADATESLEVSSDRRTLTWSSRTREVLDQARVLVRVENPIGMPFLDADSQLIGYDEITFDNCGSFFVRYTFELPVGFSSPVLTALVNADDQGVAYLNGHRISGRMTTPPPGCDVIDPSLGPNEPCYAAMDAGRDVFDSEGVPVLTWPTQDCVRTDRPGHFRPGTNELVFAVVGSGSYWDPVGLEFRAIVTFDSDPATAPPSSVFATGPVRRVR